MAGRGGGVDGGRVVVVGSLNMDLVVRLARSPAAGETVRADGFFLFPGGKGLNQAVAARRAGARVAMVGRVGTDAFGDTLLAQMDTEGIDATNVRRDPDLGTGVAAITVEAGGENRIAVVARANGALSAGDVDAARPLLQDADVVLLQAEVPLSTALRAAELAQEGEAVVVFTPAPVPPPSPELEALLGKSGVVLVNGPERAALEAAGQALAARTPGAVVVTRGGEGAVLHAPGRPPMTLPPFRVPEVDTTAAGDALAGALAAGLAEGRPLEAALRWGMAAGALACTRSGAIPALPHRAAIAGLLARSPHA